MSCESAFAACILRYMQILQQRDGNTISTHKFHKRIQRETKSLYENACFSLLSELELLHNGALKRLPQYNLFRALFSSLWSLMKENNSNTWKASHYKWQNKEKAFETHLSTIAEYKAVWNPRVLLSLCLGLGEGVESKAVWSRPARENHASGDRPDLSHETLRW